MTEQAFNQYFEEVATQLKDIAHSEASPRFAKMDDIPDKLRHGLNHDTFILAISHEQMSLMEADNLQKLQQVHHASFAILKYCPMEDSEQTEQAYTNAQLVANKIVGRMLYEFQNQQGIIRWLKSDSLSFQKIGPVAENHFGWEVSFQLVTKAGCEFTYHKNDWLWIPS